MSNLSILITTYKRTNLALDTIQHIKKNLIFDGKLHWHIADDGSPNGHIETISKELNGYHNITFSNAHRSGVGHSTNMGLAYCLERSEYVLILEDDWRLVEPFVVEDYLQLFREYSDIGMIRLAYVSPGLEGDMIATTNHRLWWRLRKGPQYTFVGHAALRTKQFINAYGKYPIGLAPGATELYMCGMFNNTKGPTVAVPAWHSIYGIFHHTGGESLKDIVPER